jgi:alanine racemase
LDVAINYTIEQIAGIIGAKLSGKLFEEVEPPLHLLLDSRKLLFPESTIFFALNTGNRNGSRFINGLYEKNVRAFVTEDNIDPAGYPGAVFLFVKNVRDALQQLAVRHREQFHLPVIGITGSNGKTIVKEWLYQLLPDHNIIRSPKSYNSQVGVPLSVLHTAGEHDLAIFEAGISQPGEMQRLEKMIRPTIGVLTNIGETHSEGFRNKKQKIKEKLFLFVHADVLICGIDDDDIARAVKKFQRRNKTRIFTWSRNGDASLKITSLQRSDKGFAINGFFLDEEIQITIPFTDDASIENAINCWCVLLELKLDNKIIAERMISLHPVEMRLQLKQGMNNCSIINDSYSADLDSLKIALDFLEQQKQHAKRTVILSDILQSARDDKELYGKVASLLAKKNIQRLIAIGPKIGGQKDLFSFIGETFFFNSVKECIATFAGKPNGSLHFNNETILIKGARLFRFEQLDRLLEQKVHQTVLSINLTSIAHNCKIYQGMLKPGVKTMAMVKAFSYGSGSYEIANLLQFNNTDYLAVAYVDEGVELRKAGITLPIMVMNPEVDSFSMLAEYDLEPEIFSFSLLASFEEFLLSSGLQFFPVHIKLDTGMHRLGFEEKDISDLCTRLANNNSLKVRSVFSHLAASEDAAFDDFTAMQATLFEKCCDQIQQALPYSFLKHIANTAAVSRHPSLQFDMVRLGIGLYGIDDNPSVQKKLKNVSALSTTIAQLKNVKKGESVGYGCRTVLQSDAVIATVRIGYADGYPRSLGNGIGKMMVNKILCPVVGNVCMDMTMLDVTGILCKEGDTVLVFGEELPLTLLASWANTIPYEIMTGVSQRVKRVYFEE